MADWTFAVGGTPPGGAPSIALSNAYGRQLTMRVESDQNHQATFTVNGKDPQAAAFTELQSDLWCWRSGTTAPIFQGRIGPTIDTLDSSKHSVAVTAWDYREVLNRRRLFTGDTLTWTAIEQATIVWNLIQATQGRAGGNLGIVQGAGAHTGVPRTISFAAGDFVTADILNLAQLDAGFDWDITPYGTQDLRVDIFYPYRGVPRGVVLEYGGSLVNQITRNVDPSTFADALLITGDPSLTLTPQQPEATDISTRPEGRWDQIMGTTYLTQTALNSHAAYMLANAETVTPSYSIVLQVNAWNGPGHIWLGDAVTVRINSGRLTVDDVLRVLEVDIAIGDNGDEKVTLQVGQLTHTFPKTLADNLRRLRNLESR
jgi:hypothetical protein